MTKHALDKRHADYDPLLLDARYRQSLAAIRWLGRHGLRVVAADTITGAAGFASRFCADRVVIPAAEDVPDATAAFHGSR